MKRIAVALLMSLVACGHAASVPDEQQPRPTTEPTPSGRPAVVDSEAERACAFDQDCAPVKQRCSWAAVNVAHREAAQRRIDAVDVSVQCASAGGPTVANSAHCVDGGCEVLTLDHVEWRACSTASDCIAIAGSCGRWDAASSTHAEELRAHYVELAARIRCATGDESPAPSPVCRLGSCVPR